MPSKSASSIGGEVYVVWWVRVCVVDGRQSLQRYSQSFSCSLGILSEMLRRWRSCFKWVGLLFNPHIRKEGCERAGALIDSK